MKGDQHNYILANGVVSKNSHSISYSFITYWTAYLKCHHPREYMAALCTNIMDDISSTAKYLAETSRMGLKIHLPDINKSLIGYTVEDDGIRIGLGALKGIGGVASDKLLEIRSQGEFKDLYDFVVRVNPSSNVLQSLAYSGALDQWGSRRGISSVANEILKVARRDSKTLDQISLFETSDVIDLKVPTVEFTKHELLQKEKEAFGIYASGHPITEYGDQSTGTTVSDALEKDLDSTSKILAVVSGVELKVTKQQKTMALLTLEDQTGILTATAFPKTYSDYSHAITEGGVVRVGLRKSYDDYREAPIYVVSFMEPVESRIPTASVDEVFGVFLPKGFNLRPSFMSRLKGLLLSSHGSTPVDLYVSRSTKIKTENQYLVCVTDKLKDNIKSLFEEYTGVIKIG